MTERKHPLAECERCPLAVRGKYVPTQMATGDSNGIVVVGEAPGRDETTTGRPFTGTSGRVLDAVLADYAIDRERTTLTNVISCRPQNNDTPTDEAISACRPRLEAEVRAADPQAIIALGNTAASAILGRKTRITKDRIGPPQQVEYAGMEVSVVPTIHPAACLRSPDHFPSLATDIGKVRLVGKSERWQPPTWRAYDNAPQATKALNQLLASDYDPVVLDIECGVDKDDDFSHPSSLLAVGFAYAKGKAIVIGEEALKDGEVRRLVARLISDKRIICHNGKYDLGVLRNLGIVDGDLYFDTMLASYVLDERGGVHGLKYLGKELFGTPDWDAEVKQYTKGGSFAAIPRDILYEYNAYDVGVTYDLYQLQLSQLSDDLRRLHDMLVRVSGSLMRIEGDGFAVSQAKLEELDKEFLAEKDQYVAEINEHLGLEQETVLKGRKGAKYEVKVWPFNPASPKQVAETLKGTYGVRVSTTSESALLELAARKKDRDSLITFIELLLSHRKVSKMHGTYVKGVDKRKRGNLIHPTFLIHGTTTGRLSCRNPNVQNWPRGDKMRSMYVPHKEGNLFVQADYGNAEGRIVAVLSRSTTLASMFREGRDVHSETAAQFFGAEFTKEQRTKAKGIVHGLNYGRTAHGIASDPSFGLNVEQVEELIEKYWELAPEVKAWHTEVHQRAIVEQQDMVSVFGRRRRFMLITPDNEHDVFKEALAWEPQSTASDICLLAATQLREEGYAVRNIVHDSILIECAEDEAEDVAQYMTKVMTDTAKREFTDKVDFYVPFPCDYDIGTNWAEV